MKIKTKHIITFLFLLILNEANSQLTIDRSYIINNDSYNLVKVKLFKNCDLSFINATIPPNDTLSVASFEYPGKDLGLNSGIILSTGLVTQVTGNASDLANGTLHKPGDADLTDCANQMTHDATQLSFSFQPKGDSIRFKFVFASEEYKPTFDPSKLRNDIFGIYLSGPNPYYPNDPSKDYKDSNIAKVPITNECVCIRSINPINGTYYKPNNNNIFRFNGYTSPMIATAKVKACGMYSIVIKIADGADEWYDSAVFIESDTYCGCDDSLHITYSNPVLDNSAIEGCSHANVCVKLCQKHELPYTIPLVYPRGIPKDIYPGSLPDNITIPPGKDSSCIEITPFIDSSNSTNILVIQSTLSCILHFDTINIKNNTQIKLSKNDTINLCEGNSLEIGETGEGGVSPYSYKWNISQEKTPFITVQSSNTLHILTVTDNCGANTTKSFYINVVPRPTSDFTFTSPVCTGKKVKLEHTGINLDGASFYWQTEKGEIPNNGKISYLDLISIAIDTDSIIDTVSLVVINHFDTTNCPSLKTINNIKVYRKPDLDFAVSNNSNNCQPLEIKFVNKSKVVSGTPHYTWNFGDSLGSDENSPLHLYTNPGLYIVKMDVFIKGMLCNETKTFPDKLINVFPKPQAGIIISPNKRISELDSAIEFSSITKNDSIYKWKFNLKDSSYINTTDFYYNFKKAGKLPGDYEIYLIETNNFGCSDTAEEKFSIILENILFVPNAFIPGKSINPENNIFRAKGMNLNSFNMKIFNRFGEIVYISNNIDVGWDGNIKNKEAPSGEYLCIIIYKDKYDRKHEHRGRLTLIR